MKIPKEVRVIETKSIELSTKDIICIKNFDDFLWLLGTGICLFKLNQCYYILTNEVIYIYEE
jgi:hypothetical protein